MPIHVEDIWTDLRNELDKFILSKVKDHAIAQDILQEVFIKIHLNLDQLKDSTKLTSWVYTITRNTITDYFNQPRLSGFSIEMTGNNENDILYQELSNCVNMKISMLPEQDREAVILTYFKGYSQKKLSDFLGMSYSGTKNRIQRAREKLKLAILNCENVESSINGQITDWQK